MDPLSNPITPEAAEHRGYRTDLAMVRALAGHASPATTAGGVPRREPRRPPPRSSCMFLSVENASKPALGVTFGTGVRTQIERHFRCHPTHRDSWPGPGDWGEAHKTGHQ